MTAPVAIIMGSQSDWDTMRHAAETLAALGVACEKHIVSAHRTPDRLFAFSKGAKAAGFKIIIAGAGGAAHLPGMAASLTELPVLGVPIESKALSGVDSLYSIVQMPAGVPVGTLAIGTPGAVNAALLAASVLALNDPALSGRLVAWRKQQTGQLGRMLAMAAARLGLRCHVFSPDPDSPAFDVVLNAACAEYADVEALELFANDVDVITYEFENVPAAAAMILGARRPVLPDRKILETTQDRLAEKDFVKRLGIGTADYADVSSAAALRAAIPRIGLPAVIKTRRFGYDGKGQAIIRDGDDLEQIWEDLGTKSAILEAFVPFDCEVSMIAARSADGHVECFDVTENEHRDHILKTSRAPAAISEALAKQARTIAESIANELDYVGVLAVEMFVLAGDAGPRLLVNEIAPRVHNSGHWTLDGASISQFEQHIRAIAGWPLGKPVRHGPVTMTNLIGDDIDSYEQWLTVPGATVHLYGKGPARPGRKMGHVTQIGTTTPKTA
jgi:5-(carboxyamino)imidazole ribonucleotide synthase